MSRRLLPFVCACIAAPALVASAAPPAGSGSATVRGAPTFVAARLNRDTASICAVTGGRTSRAVRRLAYYIDHAWSPRGDLVAVAVRFGAGVGARWHLEVMRPDGSRLKRLSDASYAGSALGVAQPAWSPRGDLIAFIRDRTLFVVRPDGRGLRRLLPLRRGPEWYAEPSWAPDGSRIFVISARLGPADRSIASVRPDGTDRRSERHPRAFAYGSYSPDRTSVAWTDDHDQLVIGSSDGTVRVAVGATIPWRPGRPVWSPDGSRIAYVRTGYDGGTEVFTADVTTGAERRVTYNALIERDVAWKPRLPRRFGACAPA
jgi:Tol biopolymer transport system component